MTTKTAYLYPKYAVLNIIKSEIEIPKSEIPYNIPPSTGITCPVM
jgi:hypothetical protein